ncbi:MAG: polysaccharide biosynthesis tyrosine autokinase [Pirellulaceae bacterium]
MNSLTNNPNQPTQMQHVEMVDEGSFDFWGILNRRKWIVFLGLVTGILLGALYHYQTAPTYRSEARVSITPKDPSFVRLSKLSNNSVQPDAIEILPERHDKRIAQPLMIEKCFEEKKLYTLDSFSTLSQSDVIEKVLSDLEVFPDPEDDYLYTLQFTALYPDDARTVLNAMVETYQKDLENEFENENQDTYKRLATMEEQFKRDYNQNSQAINELPNDDLVTKLDDMGRDIHTNAMTVLAPSIARLKSELQQLVAARERALVAIESGAEAMEKEVWLLEQQKFIEIERPRIDLPRTNTQEWLVARILEAENELETLLLRLGPSHYRVKAAQKTVDKYRQKYDELLANQEETPVIDATIPPDIILGRTIEKLDNEVDDKSEQLLAANTEMQYHATQAESLAGLRMKRTKLEEEREFIRSNLEETRSKILELDPSGQLQNSSTQQGFYFKRQMNASAGELVWPILPVVLVIGGLLGSLLGFGLGCLVDLADKTFHNPDEVIRSLGMPLIGHIPVISQSKRYVTSDSHIEPVICTYHRPKSQVSEAFRAVRTALFFNAQGKKSSIIQVTSPTPGDGKSTTAANLAVSIAQSGKRVLLVDGDMRRPRVGAIFGIDSKEGFATVLSGESLWKDVVFDCEEIEGLSIMPCGLKPSNPAELATSPHVRQLLEQMRAEFDFVVIDTPPLLAVTDPCPIATRVDGVVMTMRIKKNVRVSAERAVEVLRNLGANIVGVVVNGVGAQSGYGSQYTYGAYRSGYSYSGYGYGYGYGNYYEEKGKPTGANAGQPAKIASVPVMDDDQPIELN